MTVKILTANLNGIRSATKKGFWDWIRKSSFDFLCLQEVRANLEDLPEESKLEGYHYYYTVAEKKGYSGVALYSKVEPLSISSEFGFLDTEARFLKAEFKNFNLVSIYVPSGTSGDERQGIKYKFLDYFAEKLKVYLKDSKPYIICGDFNIAHKKIDLKNWRTNQDKSGFLPEERAWMDKVFDDIGYLDCFRVVNQEEGQYTWWSARFPSAWVNNAGWRIDYEIASSELKNCIKNVSIYKEERFSDHAPVIIEYDLD